MRRHLSLPALTALCLLALVACGGAAAPEPPTRPAATLPTADPREQEREPDSHPVAGLDLRELPTLPVVATGEQSPIALLYETSAGIAEGVTFYRGELSARGWRERADEGYVQEHAGLLVMEKEGALLSASISDLGGARVVQLRHHGNADVSMLPLYPGAEVIFAQSPQLIYAASAPVAEVADFTRAALAEQGWIAYQRPFSAYAADPSLQLLSLTRDGASLSVMVAVAPAQGDRTTVQYILGLMPVDLPLPADAADLLLDPELPYASYTTGASQAELLALYRSAMPALGWREEPAAAQSGATSAALLFRRGEGQATLELSHAAGRTTVLLSPPGPDEDPASAEAAEMEITPDPTPVAAATPSLQPMPLPADAYHVEADPAAGPAGSLRASSPSSVAALLAFYRTELLRQGWAERAEAAEGNARRASLVFARPGAVLRLELRQMANGATAIRAETARE